MERVTCDLCKGNNLKEVSRVPDRYSGREIFTLVECGTCGLVFVNPRPTISEIGKYYEGNYPSFKPTSGIGLFIKKILLKREAKKIQKEFPEQTVRLFEVGMGSGEDLSLLRTFGTFVVSGMDLSEHAVKVARERFEIESFCGPLETLDLPSVSYDVVRAKYVISHVHQPSVFLKEIARMLKPGGIVMLWLPNWNSLARKVFRTLWEGQDPPRHLYDFSPDTIRRYLQHHGFVVSSLSHSVVPNTWLHSFRNLFGGTHTGRLHPLLALLFLPFSILAALLQQSDRLVVIAKKQ